MRFSEEFRDKDLVLNVAQRIRTELEIPATLMEVCGTHTMSIARFGLKSLLPDTVRLVSGPGCPVCVTSQHDIDSFLALGSVPGMILTSFGDMLRVPGSATSLEGLRACGKDVRVVYSPLDAVDIARENPDRQVVFFAVGFETTMPATALAVESAAELGVRNFSVFCVHKTMPEALRALFSGGEVMVTGLILPGHVTTIIGADAYHFLAREFGLACAVTGFEPLDILMGIESILRQIRDRVPRIDNSYARVVKASANPKALAILSEVFEPCDAEWRGVGLIPQSGVRLRRDYSEFDALLRFDDALRDVPTTKPSACRCGDVLRGAIAPRDCKLFGTVCKPSDPEGPCMVSSEGACAAEYNYGGA